MKLQHNGREQIENIAPYSIAGDIDGAFNPANLSVGTHTLTVTSYPQPNLGGTPVASKTISFVVVDNPISSPPVLLTEHNSNRAIAFNAATFVQEPFALFTEQNFSSDKRTRVILFIAQLGSSTSSAVSSNTLVQAENSVLGTVSLPVEHIARVPNFDWLTQIKVVLPDNLAHPGDVWVRVVLNGEPSNQALIGIKEWSLGAATMPPSLMRLLEDPWITRDRRLPWQIALNRPRTRKE